MKRQGILLLAAFGLLLTGCHSTSVLTFDVWRPAKVTFPIEVSRVTVVNNSAEPDERDGNVYTDWNKSKYGLFVPHDSTSYRLTEQIAVELSESRYFPEITIFYDDSIELPKATYPPLTAQQLAVIRGGVERVTVVTLDDIDMAVSLTDNLFTDEMGETLFSTEMVVATTLNMALYWHTGSAPTVEVVTDTLYWQSFGFTPEEAHAQMPSTEALRQAAVEQISARVCHHFIPYVESVTRCIYTSTLPALADAWDYWQNQQYTEASYLWEYVYEEEKSPVARAMATANLAVYHELNDEYATAIEWVDKSLALFREKPARYTDNIAHLQDYRNQLVERRDNKSLLQEQM